MRFLVVALAALALAAPAGASEQHPTLAELEGEVICLTCHTTLDMSNSPFADRMRVFIRGRIAAGDTKSEIKSKLVAQFGKAFLAEPPKRGFDLLAWVLPIGGLLPRRRRGRPGRAWRWSRQREIVSGRVLRRRGPHRSILSSSGELDEELERLRCL